jgi:hypothetical protein
MAPAQPRKERTFGTMISPTRGRDLETVPQDSAFSRFTHHVSASRDLIRAGQFLKIDVLHHVIIGNGDRSSLRELGYFL